MSKPRTKKEIFHYLANHFRYDTMSSWNNRTSYAMNIKLHHLPFPDKATEDRAWDLIQVQSAFLGFRQVLEEFARKHYWEYQIHTNGRSGGYLVLMQGGRKDSGYKSYCTDCGQQNYTVVEETGHRCGKCHEESRMNYLTPVYTVFTTGHSLDQGEDFAEWSLEELRSRRDLIWDFDRACRQAVQAFIDFCKGHEMKTYTYLEEREGIKAIPLKEAS